MNRVLGEAFETLPSNAHAEFAFFSISGLSAAGKDVLLHRIMLDMPDALGLEVLRKFVVRKSEKAPLDHEEAVGSRAELDAMMRGGGAVFRYSLGDDRDYAFDAEQFSDAFKSGGCLLAVVTEPFFLPVMTKAISDRGGFCKSVWIEVPEVDARIRTHLRSFEDEEKARREKYNLALGAKIERRGRDSFLADYDKVVVNDDRRGIALSAKELLEYLGDELAKAGLQ